jgi:hypothetical protein
MLQEALKRTGPPGARLEQRHPLRGEREEWPGAALGECGVRPSAARAPARPAAQGSTLVTRMPVNARGEGADVPSMILSSDRMVSASRSMIASGSIFTLLP